MEQIKYLKGLDSLRFFLAMIVLIGHCRLNLIQNNISWYNEVSVFRKGFISVEFFFILSGFLLTYLAYYEIKKTGVINYKKFFIKRALRILPLYYLCVFLGFFMLGFLYPIFKEEKYLAFSLSEAIWYYIFLVPNYVISIYREGTGSLFSLWSIGVEEQFYILFPFLMSFTFNKFRKPLLSLLIVFLFFYSIYFISYYKLGISISNQIRYFMLTFKFHFMMLGAITAYLFIKIQETDFIYNILYNKISQILGWIFFITIFFITDLSFDKFHLLQGLLFCYIIFITINDKHRLVNIEIWPFHWLGKMSYGIYLFHPIVSYPVRFVMGKNGVFKNAIVSFPVLYYLIVSMLTILISVLSYRYFEGYFLRLKDAYKKDN